MHPELPCDILADFVSRCCRECKNGWTAQSFHDGPEHQVVGTEVVPPLADAMGFDDDKETYGSRQESLEEITILESLRRQIKALPFAIQHPPPEGPRPGLRAMR